MEYPILPGSVISQEVAQAGQRVAPRYGPQRPNAVERQIQYVDSIPMQRPAVYAQENPAVIPTTLPGYQQVAVRPIIQQHVAAPVAYAAPAHVPSGQAKSERCCTTRVTIVVSVFIVCLLIGAGIGMYYKFGRDEGNDSQSNEKENADNHYHNCVTIDMENNEKEPVTPGKGDEDSSKPHENDDDEKEDHDDADGDDSKPETEKDDDKSSDGKEDGKDNGDNVQGDESKPDDGKDSDKSEEKKEDAHKEGGKGAKGDGNGKHPSKGGKHIDRDLSWIPDCFHEKEDGSFELQHDAGIIYYDNSGDSHWLQNHGQGNWMLNDDDTLTLHDNSNDKLPDGVHLCRD